MLAAFDVAGLHTDFPERFPSPDPPSLLLIAHRKEILQQALATFRQVLRDPAFGKLWLDGEMPSQWRHGFASVQSLTLQGTIEIPPVRFDVLIVDTFHHAAELSLWTVLDQGLPPFHYFAVANATDLCALEWHRGGPGGQRPARSGGHGERSQGLMLTAQPFGTGQRTLHHASRGGRVMLFMHEHRRQDGRPGGITEPFRCLGFATCESHEGERPIAIRWSLERSIPAA